MSMSFMSIVNCNFFFFKQKTAYEMRISDWSSDVCSSDLAELGRLRREIQIFEEIGRPAIHEGVADEEQDVGDEDRHQRAIAQRIAGCVQQIGRASCRERVCQYV